MTEARQHFTLVLIHPLEGGYLRRKYRMDRRPGMPIESPWIFYPRYAAEFLSKHYRIARLVWRYYWFVRSLKKYPDARNYTDLALTPVRDNEIATLEMFHVLAAK